MRAKGYTVRYVCTECGNIHNYQQYGIKSDMMMSLRRIVDPPFCHKCSTTNRMDVLCVISELCATVNRKYHVAWRCDKCYSRWSTDEQLKHGQNFSELGVTKGEKPSCIRQACDSKPENIRLTCVNKVP